MTTHTATADLVRAFVDSFAPVPAVVERSRLSRWAKFLERTGTPIEDADGGHLERWADALSAEGMPQAAIDNCTMTVRNFYSWLAFQGLAISWSMLAESSDIFEGAPHSQHTGRTNGTVPLKVPSGRQQLGLFSDNDLLSHNFLDSIASPHSRRHHKTALNSWSSFLASRGIAATAATDADYDTWVAELHEHGLSDATISRHAACTKAFRLWLHAVDGHTATAVPHAIPDPLNTETTPTEAGTSRDGELLERFLSTVENVYTRKSCRVALNQWLLFLAKNGTTAEHTCLHDQHTAWITDLRRRGVQDKSITTYTGSVKRFYRWLKETEGNRTDGPRRTPVIRDPNPQKQTLTPSPTEATLTHGRELLEQFLGTLTGYQTTSHYRSALINWWRFLASRGIALTVATEADYDTWVAELHKLGRRTRTIRYYTHAVQTFRRWADTAHAGTKAGVAGAAPRVSMAAGTAVPPAEEASASHDDATDMGVLTHSSVKHTASTRPARSDSAWASGDVFAEIRELAVACDAHEHRLDDLDDKVSQLLATLVQPVHDDVFDEIKSRQKELGRRWDTVASTVAAMMAKLSVLVESVQAGYDERSAWAREMNEMSKRVRTALYQQADPTAREMLAAQPQARSSCEDEVDMLICNTFRGLETCNIAIIDGAAKLDNAPQGQAWASKLHTALLALDDYAQTDYDGDFKSFCETMLPGHNVVPATWVARHEPAATTDNSRYRNERTFPVPSTVDQGGKCFMPEHIVLGNGGIAPRLHYYDDKRGQTRKVHIGYIGPHLPSRDT